MATRAPSRSKPAALRSPPVRPRFFESDWPIILLLAIAIFAAFSPACDGEFLNWDDAINVSKNPRLNPATLAKDALFWKNPYANLYIPVTYSAWSLLARMVWMDEPDSSGNSLTPGIFHVANLVVHLIAALALYALLLRLVRRRWPAAAGALLFAVHPLQVEPVAWITGLKDVLAGAFAIIALWQYATFADERVPTISRVRGGVHYALAILAYLLALLSKPSAVAVPLAALVLDRWVMGRSWKRVIPGLAPLLALMIGAIFFSRWVQPSSVPADEGHVFLRPLIAGDALAFYLYKLFFPLSLGFQYDRAPMTVIGNGAIYITWLAPAALILAIVLFRGKAPWLLPSAALFVIGVAPVRGLAPFDYQHFSTVADRYVYLSMLGPAFMLAALLARWNGAQSSQRAAPVSHRAIAVVAVLLGLLAVRSFLQSFVWRDNRSLALHGLTVNPRSFVALDLRAVDLIREKQFGHARIDAGRAVELAPQSPDGYVALGTIDDMEADPAAAVVQFRTALALAPYHPEALCGLGEAYLMQGKLADAESVLRRAIAVNFETPRAHGLLGRVLRKSGRGPEAFDETKLAVYMDPGDAAAQFDWAMFLSVSNPQKSLSHVKIALKIEPDMDDAKRLYQALTGAGR
jgi:cytochrome c-type biogenesis protein CcmH/NrfG